MWEKEKLLVTSNFSFPRIVFKRLVMQTCKNQGLFGKGLTFRHAMKMIFQLQCLFLLLDGTDFHSTFYQTITYFHDPEINLRLDLLKKVEKGKNTGN